MADLNAANIPHFFKWLNIETEKDSCVVDDLLDGHSSRWGPAAIRNWHRLFFYIYLNAEKNDVALCLRILFRDFKFDAFERPPWSP
jgi:hypothetical protein